MKKRVSDILKNTSSNDLKYGIMPDFDYPPPNYNVVPEKDRGWLAITKAILIKNSSYSKAVGNSKLIQAKEKKWKELSL